MDYNRKKEIKEIIGKKLMYVGAATIFSIILKLVFWILEII